MTTPMAPEPYNPFAPPSLTTPSTADPFGGPLTAPLPAATAGTLPLAPEAVSVPTTTPRGAMNRSATLALALACSSLVFTPVVGLAGVLVGRQALAQVAMTGERGASRARAAIRIGIAGAVLWATAVAFVIAMNAGATAA